MEEILAMLALHYCNAGNPLTGWKTGPYIPLTRLAKGANPRFFRGNTDNGKVYGYGKGGSLARQGRDTPS